MGSHARGFTIIEVILFLAISGLLLAGAMAGMTSNINNSRFNDAIRSTTSYIQRQYSELGTGVSNRPNLLNCDTSANVSVLGPTKPPGMTNCVVMGRFIKIEGTRLTTRYIIGYRASLSGLSADDTLAIRSMLPRVAGTETFANEYEVPWGIRVVETRLPSGVFAATGFAIIRSPASGNIVFYAFQTTPGAPEPALTNALISSNRMNQNVDVCLADSSSGRYGHIKVEAGQGQEVIQTDLSSTAGACW